MSRTPTRRPATTRSSTRPCGASASRNCSVSTPSTRKSASFESSPSSSSRTAPPTRYASSPSPPTYSSISFSIRPFWPQGLQERDRFDLDESAGRQLRHLDRGARGRVVAGVLRVDGVHSLEVVEVLEEDGRLHEPVKAGARLAEDRGQVRKDPLGLLLDPARDRSVAGLQAELARDEDEAARGDRLRVRRSLERRRGALGADDGLLAHSVPPMGSHAWASAAPSALKIA